MNYNAYLMYGFKPFLVFCALYLIIVLSSGSLKRTFAILVYPIRLSNSKDIEKFKTKEFKQKYFENPDMFILTEYHVLLKNENNKVIIPASVVDYMRYLRFYSKNSE